MECWLCLLACCPICTHSTNRCEPRAAPGAGAIVGSGLRATGPAMLGSHGTTRGGDVESVTVVAGCQQFLLRPNARRGICCSCVCRLPVSPRAVIRKTTPRTRCARATRLSEGEQQWHKAL